MAVFQIITFFLIFGLIEASKVSFYESENYIGLLAELDASTNCTNLPRRAFSKSNSLSTTSCLLLYTGENCGQTSIRIQPGSYPSLKSNITHQFNQNFGNAIKSFVQCSNPFETPRITFYQESELLAEYTNFCDCLTLPSTIDRATRLDNHGTCVNLHLEPHGIPPSCTSSPVTIQGGTSLLSENLRNLTHSETSWKRIVAISPCTQALTKCTHLSAVVAKFSVASDLEAVSILSSTSSMAMAITTSFRNNGSARVSEMYTATKSITESSETKLVSSYSRMDNWTVETGFSAEFSQDVPMVSTASISASLYSAYNMVENSSKEESHIHRKEISTNFSVSQKIDIEPCSVYNVNSFVRMVHNYPVNYKVYCKVSGVIGRRILTAREIRERLGDLEWVEDYDEYTVVAVGEGQLMADFGVETIINGEGKPIENCLVGKTNSLPKMSSDNQNEFSSSNFIIGNIELLVSMYALYFILYANM